MECVFLGYSVDHKGIVPWIPSLVVSTTLGMFYLIELDIQLTLPFIASLPALQALGLQSSPLCFSHGLQYATLALASSHVPMSLRQSIPAAPLTTSFHSSSIYSSFPCDVVLVLLEAAPIADAQPSISPCSEPTCPLMCTLLHDGFPNQVLH